MGFQTFDITADTPGIRLMGRMDPEQKPLALDWTGCGVEFLCGDKPFTFCARPYKNSTLCKAKHLEDLHDDRLVCLNLDGFMRGTGSNSCGPDVQPQYDLKIRDSLAFSFYLRPIRA